MAGPELRQPEKHGLRRVSMSLRHSEVEISEDCRLSLRVC